ncbi:MAG: 5-aminolevulinate synthase, partial [Pseudomonadota bacterium]
MDTEAHLARALERLHEEGRYRTFIDIERTQGNYPNATWTKPCGAQVPITVWCGND